MPCWPRGWQADQASWLVSFRDSPASASHRWDYRHTLTRPFCLKKVLGTELRSLQVPSQWSHLLVPHFSESCLLADHVLQVRAQSVTVTVSASTPDPCLSGVPSTPMVVTPHLPSLTAAVCQAPLRFVHREAHSLISPPRHLCDFLQLFHELVFNSFPLSHQPPLFSHITFHF